MRDQALTWWQQFGSKSLPPDVFLARFVKPSDSDAARKELPTLRQGELSVEHFAAMFRSEAQIVVSLLAAPLTSPLLLVGMLAALSPLSPNRPYAMPQYWLLSQQICRI